MDPKQRALDTLIAKYREHVELIPAESLPLSAFGFDQTGWELYHVDRPSKRSSTLSGDEYVAVHPATGQIKFLGYH